MIDTSFNTNQERNKPMTVAGFINDTITLRKPGVTFITDLGEFEAKMLRDQLLTRYPVESEATPVAGPLHEVTLAEARPGDIATFESKYTPAKGIFVCTLKKMDEDMTLCDDDMTLLADKWLTANKRPSWCIRSHTGDDGGCMRDLHIWRWDGVEEAVEEAVELPDQPMVAGLYITATSDQVLYNNGDVCANWSRPHGARWSTGCTYENWKVVTRDLGPERLPLKFISKKED